MSTGSNYEKIPKKISGFRFESKKIRIGFCKIRGYYPCFWEKVNSKLEGEFDFKSIMLYSNIKVKPNKTYMNEGFSTTRYNTELSETDIKTVCRLY